MTYIHVFLCMQTVNTSMEGAAAPYAVDITRYLNLRNRVSKITTEAEYKSLFKALISRNVKITIPIFYIKVCVCLLIFVSKESLIYAASCLHRTRQKERISIFVHKITTCNKSHRTVLALLYRDHRYGFYLFTLPGHI